MLQSLLRQTQVLCCFDDLLHRQAFVPWLASESEDGEGSPIANIARRIRPQRSLAVLHTNRGSLQGDKGDVVLLLPLFAREAGQLGQQEVDEISVAIRAVDGDQLTKPREAEHLALEIVGLHQPI